MATAVKKLPNLLEKYRKEVVPALIQEFGYKNLMQVPKIQKVVLNRGIKESQEDVKLLEQFSYEMGVITGQRPITTRAKKSIAGFKLRKDMPVGLKVTLRGTRMYEFLERLFTVAMPRIRDFRGYSEHSFDNGGNYTFGIQEQTIFPEIKYDEVRRIKGMDVTLVTSSKTGAEAKKLLECLGFPFRKH